MLYSCRFQLISLLLDLLGSERGVSIVDLGSALIGDAIGDRVHAAAATLLDLLLRFPGPLPSVEVDRFLPPRTLLPPCGEDPPPPPAAPARRHGSQAQAAEDAGGGSGSRRCVQYAALAPTGHTRARA